MKKNKIIISIVLAMLLIFSYTTIAIETSGEDIEKNESNPSNIEGSLPYQGFLKIYVVEPESRWDNYDNEPYHYGFLNFAFNDTVSIDYLDTFSETIIWNGNDFGYGDIQEDNIMVIATIFNPEIQKAYAEPPTRSAFETHYVDATAGAKPGDTVSNVVNENFTHSVFVEEGTDTWCPYCPAMANALNNVYLSGDYPFYYVALIGLSGEHEEAYHRLVNELNLQGYPSAWFDGGKKVILGGVSNENSYRSGITLCGKIDVHELDFSVSLEWIGNGELSIDISITNNEGFFNSPPEKPTITGPTSAQYGEEQTYEITATDPDDNDIYYYIDFGDGTEEIIKGPYDSGKKSYVKHTWEKKGTYNIKVRSRDSYDEKSDWVTLEVAMPKNKSYINTPFSIFLEKHPHMFILLRQLLEL